VSRRDPAAARPSGRGLDAEILALAIPAFATLLAEPLLVLADSAIVGHVSTVALAGLGVAASVIGLVVGLCVFLAYGTTAQVSRLLGAGDRRGALTAGLDGIVLGVLVGAVLAVGVGGLAAPIIGLYQVSPDVAAQATTYLRIMAVGFPAALVVLAATGVLRGLQDTRTPLLVVVGLNVVNVGLNLGFVHGLGWGIAGSATGTVISQYLAAGLLAAAVWHGARREHLRWVWHPGNVVGAARSSGWLVVRTIGLQAALLTTTAVAARMGTSAMAAHQVLNGLWMLLVFAMDAIAIAAQAIVGRYLGAGEAAVVRSLLRRMIGWGIGVGLAGGLALWSGQALYLRLFSPDPDVLGQVGRLLPLLAALTVVSAVVFVLDGVLIGAGDARYLALASLVNLATYLPVAMAVALTGAGLPWLWAAYGWLALSRLATLGLRARGTRWMRLGA